eukprot:TRINITY_DN5016_c0_g1_i1.p1 TRINITY_DN5016_c0_g1~~TRINITY_DN5016_c0_g1_i1.p1  ORF type:complete len:295 (-),score=9.98 TRINITY_DN5016_c0_g1_i1:173-1057(-)
MYILSNLTERKGILSQWSVKTVSGVKGRAGHLTFMYNDRMFVHGGYGSGSRAFGDLYSIDLSIQDDTIPAETVEYNTEGSGLLTNISRRWHTGSAAADKLFIFGGWNTAGPLANLCSFDLLSKKWAPLNFDNEPCARRWHGWLELGTTSSENDLQTLVYAGYNGDKKRPLSDMHICNFGAQEWISIEQRGDIPKPSMRMMLVALDHKRVLRLGGKLGTSATYRDVHILYLDTFKWEQVSQIGNLYPLLRDAARIVKIPPSPSNPKSKQKTTSYIVGGGYSGTWVEPFYRLEHCI